MPKLIVICEHCAKKVEKIPSQVRERNFCSRECVQKDRKANFARWKM